MIDGCRGGGGGSTLTSKPAHQKMSGLAGERRALSVGYGVKRKT